MGEHDTICDVALYNVVWISMINLVWFGVVWYIVAQHGTLG